MSTSPPDGDYIDPAEPPPGHTGPPAVSRRVLITGAAALGLLGVGGAVAWSLNGGGGTTPVATGTTTTKSPTRSATTSTSRTTSGTTTANPSTSSPATTSSAGATTTTAAPTTTRSQTSRPPTTTKAPPPPPTTTKPPTSTTKPPTTTTPPPPPPPTVLQGGNSDDDDGNPKVYLTKDGKNVKQLPAGDYTIHVHDPAKFHNFHLTGPGVNKATGVEEIVDVTWNVTFQPGSYQYVCDPHAAFMNGSFTVS